MSVRNMLVAGSLAIFYLAQLQSASAQLWKYSTGTLAPWSSVASSADGTKLVVAGGNGAIGPIFTSTNGGATWVSNNAPVTTWTGVASSADGNRLVAVNSGGGVYTNSGINWTSSPLTIGGSPPAWQCVASSASGSNLVVAGAQLTTNLIFYSTNGGLTWAQATNPNVNLQSMACSGDGSNVFAAGNAVVTSTNSGANWHTLTNSPVINDIVCSTNGLGLAGLSTAGSGPVYTSTNAGRSWITNTVAANPASPWTCIASSADGTKLLVGTTGAGIFHSFNAGFSWTKGTAPAIPWTAAASSADGTNLVATATNYVFIGRTPLPVLNLTLFGTNILVSWPTNVAGYGLYLFYNTNLVTNLWQFTPFPVITNNVYRVTFPATNSPLYFKLEPAV